MEFKKALDQLAKGPSHADIAEALGCSVASLRQARADASNKAHRAPPQGWETGLARIARTRAASLERLADRLVDK